MQDPIQQGKQCFHRKEKKVKRSSKQSPWFSLAEPLQGKEGVFPLPVVLYYLFQGVRAPHLVSQP